MTHERYNELDLTVGGRLWPRPAGIIVTTPLQDGVCAAGVVLSATELVVVLVLIVVVVVVVAAGVVVTELPAEFDWPQPMPRPLSVSSSAESDMRELRFCQPAAHYTLQGAHLLTTIKLTHISYKCPDQSLTNQDSCQTSETTDKQKSWANFCRYDLSAFHFCVTTYIRVSLCYPMDHTYRNWWTA